MSFLSDEEIKALRDSFAQSRGNRSRSFDEMEKILDWAEQVKFGQMTLENVLDGVVSVDVTPDGKVVFCLTALGEIEAGDLLEDNGIDA